MSIKVAIVGTGNVARQSYLPHLAAREDVALTYYNRTRTKAEAVAAQFGGRVAGSLAELVGDDPDTVLVLTHETQRYDAVKHLLALAPRRLFFEKPLVARHGQADVVEEDFHRGQELLLEARSAGTETAMVFNYRFFDQSVQAHELVAGGELGAPVHFTALVHYACWSHCIDLLLHFVGPVAEIAALAGAQGPGGPVGEGAAAVAASVRATHGATGTIIGTAAMDFGAPLYELTLAYERGRISMRDLDGPMEVIDYARRRYATHSLSYEVSRWDQYRASFGRSLDAYLAAIQAGQAPPIPGLAGLRELQFEAALKRSIAQGRPVALEKEFPIDPALAG